MISLISALDLKFEMFLLSVRDPSLVQFFIWVSELGNDMTIIGLTFVVLIIFAYRRKWPKAVGLAMSVFGSAVAGFILKELVARPRPGAPLYAYIESNPYSLPSVHSIFAVAFYAFLLWLIWDFLSPVWRKGATIVVAVLILAIGFSRLYLGVHYPSDVLTGYVVGAVFVIVGIKITRILSQRLNSSGAEQSNL